MELYKSIFEFPTVFRFSIREAFGKIKGLKEHEFNMLVYYGSTYQRREPNRLVCEVPVSRESLQELADELWEKGIYPTEAKELADKGKKMLKMMTNSKEER